MSGISCIYSKVSDLRPSGVVEPYGGNGIIRIRFSSEESAPSLLPQVVCWKGGQRCTHKSELIASAYLTQSDKSPELDEAMKIAKGYVNRYVDDIYWIAKVMAPKLDVLCESENPQEQKSERHFARIV